MSERAHARPGGLIAGTWKRPMLVACVYLRRSRFPAVDFVVVVGSRCPLDDGLALGEMVR